MALKKLGCQIPLLQVILFKRQYTWAIVLFILTWFLPLDSTNSGKQSKPPHPLQSSLVSCCSMTSDSQRKTPCSYAFSTPTYKEGKTTRRTLGSRYGTLQFFYLSDCDPLNIVCPTGLIKSRATSKSTVCHRGDCWFPLRRSMI